MAFAPDSNRPQPLWQPPPTAYLTASGAASEVPSLRMHPWRGPLRDGRGHRVGLVLQPTPMRWGAMKGLRYTARAITWRLVPDQCVHGAGGKQSLLQPSSKLLSVLPTLSPGTINCQGPCAIRVLLSGCRFQSRSPQSQTGLFHTILSTAILPLFRDDFSSSNYLFLGNEPRPGKAR